MYGVLRHTNTDFPGGHPRHTFAPSEFSQGPIIVRCPRCQKLHEYRKHRPRRCRHCDSLFCYSDNK